MRSGIGRGKKEGQHEYEAKPARRAHQDAENQSQTDRQLAIGDEESERGRVRQDKTPEHRNHEGIGAVRKESGDVPSKPAAQGELSAENFVLSEDQEEDAHGDAKEGERACVAVSHCGLSLVERLPFTTEAVSISRLVQVHHITGSAGMQSSANERGGANSCGEGRKTGRRRGRT